MRPAAHEIDGVEILEFVAAGRRCSIWPSVCDKLNVAPLWIWYV